MYSKRTFTFKRKIFFSNLLILIIPKTKCINIRFEYAVKILIKVYRNNFYLVQFRKRLFFDFKK